MSISKDKELYNKINVGEKLVVNNNVKKDGFNPGDICVLRNKKKDGNYYYFNVDNLTTNKSESNVDVYPRRFSIYEELDDYTKSIRGFKMAITNKESFIYDLLENNPEIFVEYYNKNDS
jgi:hypothetical protein